MEAKDFALYIDVLTTKPFALYPPPQGKDEMQNGQLRAAKFNYLDHTPTHVIIEEVATKKTYHIPLVLVEFANPGVLRLSRELAPWNGSFL